MGKKKGMRVMKDKVRVIDGVKFTWDGTRHGDKEAIEERKRLLKKHGFLVRVFKRKSGNKYVYMIYSHLGG
jgi:hypothetical protein